MLNKCIFMGRLAADPELRRTGSGTACCTFRLAVDRDFKGQDGQKATDWLNFVAWRGTAEFITRNFRKGQPMVVETRAQARTYEKDGQNHNVVEFVVGNAYFAGGKQDDRQAPSGYTQDYGYPPEDDRLPWED